LIVLWVNATNPNSRRSEKEEIERIIYFA